MIEECYILKRGQPAIPKMKAVLPYLTMDQNPTTWAGFTVKSIIFNKNSGKN